MLFKVFTAVALFGLLVREGKSQCFIDTACSGDTIAAADLRSCCVNTNDGLAFNDGTTCTVCIVHGFANASFNVDEDSRLDTEFRLNVKGNTDLPITLPGFINAEAAGTAEASDFQQLLPIRVQESSATIRVFTSNDPITLEYDDQIRLTFTPDNPGFITGVEGLGQFVRTEAIINIVDNDDLLLINFGEADLTITEGSMTLSSPMILQFRENQNPFTVMLSPVTISAAESKGLGTFIAADTITESFRATAGADFTDNVISITVPANRRFFEIDAFFNISRDNIDEDEQSFAVVAEIGQDVPDGVSCFQIADGQEGCTTERQGATRIRINDTDTMIIGFVNRTQKVNESDGPLGSELFPIAVELATVIISERVHDMTVRLQETISNATVTTPEEATGDLDYDATFGGRFEMFEPITENIRLVAGDNSFIPIQIDIRNDFSSEPLECFTIRITPDDVPGRRELFTCNEDDTSATSHFCEHTICICDDDDPFKVAFVETTYTVPESVGEVEICVNLTEPSIDILDETVNVFAIHFPDSIHIPPNGSLATPEAPDFLGRFFMADGTDFNQQTFAINDLDDTLITELRRIVCYNQMIYDDDCVEEDEYMGLSLGVEDNALTTVQTFVCPPFDQLSICILDDDMAVVGLEQTFFNVSEGVGVVEICAVVFEPAITCPIKFPFNVRLATSDGTAVEPMDYGAVDMILSFASCENRSCVNISIVQDLVDELDENLIYTLSRTPDLNPRIELRPVDGVGLIRDDDVNVTVGYDPISYTTTETMGIVTLTIRIFDPPVGGSPKEFSLSISTTDGTAIAADPDNDYEAVINGIVTFDVGATSVTHDIIINNDDTCEDEPNEHLFSNIALLSGMQPIFVINPQATVTIIDTLEPECLPIEVGYEFSSYTTTETIGYVTLCAVIDNFPNGAPRPFVIDATTENAGAVAGVDYDGIVDFPLMFEMGDTRVCHNITIRQDDICETPMLENFFSNLEYASGLMPIVITRPRTEVFINDTTEPECEPITVGYNPTIYTTTETEGRVELTIEVFSHPGGSPRPFDLVINTMDGTATVVDGDYDAVNGLIISFARGDVTKMHTIIINDDMDCETMPDEMFFSSITSVTGIPPITVTEPQATITIIDNNEPECIPIDVGYEFTSYTTTETTGYVTLCAIVFSPTNGAPRPFVINATTSDGIAQSGVDYNGIVDLQLMFAEGEDRVCHNVTILQDDICETPVIENFFSNLVYDSGGLPIFITQPTTEVIIDDSTEPECEPITVGYNPTIYTTTETEGSVDLTIEVFSHSGGSPRPFDLVINTMDGTATVADGDYDAVNGLIISFARGDVTKMHTIIINDDNNCETMPDEMFFSSITSVTGIPLITVTEPQATIIIADMGEPECNPIEVGYEFPSYTTSETIGYVTLCAVIGNLPNGAPRPFTINATTENGVAVAGVDYDGIVDFPLMFDIGDTRVCHNITILQDDICERPLLENFFSNLVYDMGEMPIIITRPRTEVFIDDTTEPECEPITVGYNPNSYTVTETEGSVELTIEVFSHPGGSPRPFDLLINTMDGSATVVDGDYDAVNGVIISFDRGDVTKMHTIIINDDDICEKEPNEIFFSNIMYSSGILPIDVIVPQATILINDTNEPECEPITVGYNPDFYTVTETEGSVDLTIEVFSHPGGSPRPFDLVINTMDGTATVADGDYNPVNGLIISFDRGDVTKMHTIIINDDNDCERDPNEIFFSNIMLSSGIPDIDVTVPRATILINDTSEPECEPITVGYNPDFYTVTETEGSVDLTIEVFSHPGGSPRPFDLVINTMDGTATVADGDYDAVNGLIISFARGDVTKMHTIIINDDMDCERDPNEIFTSNIMLSSGIPDIDVTVPRATILIDDSSEPECDPIEVGYEFPRYTTTETIGYVTLCAVIGNFPNGAPRSFIINATTTDGGAFAGVDYDGIVDFPLMFEIGDTRVCHNITIRQDDICETLFRENFFSNLEYASGLMPIVITRPRTEVIIDDATEPECEPIRVGYEMTEFTVTEGVDSSVELCVILYEPVLNGPAPRPFVLSFTTSDGSATSGEDYDPSSGQLNFAAGERRQCHTVNIIDNNICERPPIEDLFSTLDLVSGVPVIVVSPPRARIVIDDSLDCTAVKVNDTLTGDPLMTVPIFTDPDVRPGDPIDSLCYEVHGENGSFFNLISDDCTSVNAFYSEAITPSPNIDLNVVSQIGVRARGNSACWNIEVHLASCSASLEGGAALPGSSFDGIQVRSYPSSSRVRIAVPNCRSDMMLVMWIFCRSGEVEDPVTWVYYPINFIRFVVMRGLNLNDQSHGLIGQFWNVPVTVSPYTGLFGGVARPDDYVITVDHPQAPPRSFVGLKSDITWEFERRVCYYVGNTQAGKLAEVDTPNDSVIEGEYTDYKVASLFSTDFTFTHFDETMC